MRDDIEYKQVSKSLYQMSKEELIETVLEKKQTIRDLWFVIIFILFIFLTILSFL
jgi:hypothetical protein